MTGGDRRPQVLPGQVESDRESLEHPLRIRVRVVRYKSRRTTTAVYPSEKGRDKRVVKERPYTRRSGPSGRSRVWLTILALETPDCRTSVRVEGVPGGTLEDVH